MPDIEELQQRVDETESRVARLERTVAREALAETAAELLRKGGAVTVEGPSPDPELAGG